jgi:transcription elongation factor GreA
LGLEIGGERAREEAIPDGSDLDRDPGSERFGDEVLAVEEDAPVVSARPRERTKLANERVLPAGDAFHCAYCTRRSRAPTKAASARATINPMKARILKKFEDEIQQLERELKTELPKEIKRARELGDLRENAEYHAAKERQRLVESRISLLKKRVSEIALMNLDKIPRDRVGFGSTVHLKGEVEQLVVYQLVMPEDADVEHGLISTASPIGRALLNKEEGDEVTVTTPIGSKRFEVVKLLTIHDE